MQRPYFFLLLPVLLALLLSPKTRHDSNFLTISPNPGKSHRILLLTAHPDDECMFFAPTLLHLLSASTQSDVSDDKVYSLCLSSGNASGLGEARKKELAASLDVLGVTHERRQVLDEPFGDNLTELWDPELVAQHVKTFVLRNNIDVILTFDNHGISSHPNHISLFYGASSLLTDPVITTRPSTPPLRVFTLRTVSIVEKYTGLLGPLVQNYSRLVCRTPAARFLPGCYDRLRSISFISGVRDYSRALTAMMRHQSQFVWFRWLYVAFSRYMWLNDWVEITPSPLL
ncbi:LmbE-like protein [Rickenella mellea]|uniref:N-acetylglucosaminylphosphatidylinositol deacetylase n=1 Tax=Rickenella mellea TaxID=50990 RepID=A0A4Y7Q5L0_9AGAM|nr:LmbE-like protein [Rickenella mellea]